MSDSDEKVLMANKNGLYGAYEELRIISRDAMDISEDESDMAPCVRTAIQNIGFRAKIAYEKYLAIYDAANGDD